MKSAVEKVTAVYGDKRVAWVMAAMVQRHDYDGRYSAQNKAWAQGLQIPPEQHYGDSKPMIPYYGTNAHATLIDGFINRLREHMAQKKECKPSVTGQIKQDTARLAAAKPAKEQAKTKKEQEL